MTTYPVAIMLVNRLFDLAEFTDVKKRQAVNDVADKYVMEAFQEVISLALREAGVVQVDEDTYERVLGDDLPVPPDARVGLAGDDYAVEEIDEPTAVQALRLLVMLKDGPRDARYEELKPQAWEMARTVLRSLDQ